MILSFCWLNFWGHVQSHCRLLRGGGGAMTSFSVMDARFQVCAALPSDVENSGDTFRIIYSGHGVCAYSANSAALYPRSLMEVHKPLPSDCSSHLPLPLHYL